MVHHHQGEVEGEQNCEMEEEGQEAVAGEEAAAAHHLQAWEVEEEE